MRAADAAGVAEAARLLCGGGLVALPTETVYGLAADAQNAHAVARIFAAKGRPRFNPLIAHLLGPAEAAREAVLSPLAERLMAAFWPGPLTLVLPRAPQATVCELACAGLATIALRAPAHPVMRAVLEACGRPLAAPSANRSGHVSPTTAAHVAADFPTGLDLILDAGPCALGLESTVVGILPDGPPTLLRPGALARGTIEAVAGPLAAPGPGLSSPGQLQSHYAPAAGLRLNATAPEAGEAMLGFGAVAGDLNLSPAGDVVEAAANLFAHLRTLDARGPARIAVAPIPDQGVGEAIQDRLRRAAAPRELCY